MKLARFAILTCGVAAACAEAGGGVKGGEITDAGLQAATPGEFDGGYVPPDRKTPCGEGVTWSSLYRDIFGPTGQPGSCSFQGYCHGTRGSEANGHLSCLDEADCEASFRKQLSGATKAKPQNASLLTGVLKVWTTTKDGGVGTRGIMPREPYGFVFPDACIERLKGWIATVAPAE